MEKVKDIQTLKSELRRKRKIIESLHRHLVFIAREYLCRHYWSNEPCKHMSSDMQCSYKGKCEMKKTIKLLNSIKETELK